MDYTMTACIIDQLTLRGAMCSDDIKHMCRLNVEGFGSYEYMTAIHILLNEKRIERVAGMDDSFQLVQP